MKVRNLFRILDLEDYSAEELNDVTYLRNRIGIVLDWEGVQVSEERVEQLAALYRANRTEVV